MSMYMTLEIVYYYTNINFTEKQKSDPAKLYDLLAGSGFFDDFFAVLPQTEYNTTARHNRIQVCIHLQSYPSQAVLNSYLCIHLTFYPLQILISCMNQRSSVNPQSIVGYPLRSTSSKCTLSLI